VVAVDKIQQAHLHQVLESRQQVAAVQVQEIQDKQVNLADRAAEEPGTEVAEVQEIVLQLLHHKEIMEELVNLADLIDQAVAEVLVQMVNTQIVEAAEVTAGLHQLMVHQSLEVVAEAKEEAELHLQDLEVQVAEAPELNQEQLTLEAVVAEAKETVKQVDQVVQVLYLLDIQMVQQMHQVEQKQQMEVQLFTHLQEMERLQRKYYGTFCKIR
jgi:hypothetical protein